MLGAWLLWLLTMRQDRPAGKDVEWNWPERHPPKFYFPCSMSDCVLHSTPRGNPPSPTYILPPPALSGFLQAGAWKKFHLPSAWGEGAQLVLWRRERAEKLPRPWGARRVSVLPALCLCGWNFPGASPSNITIALQTPRNATHENAFLAHSWHGQHLVSKESAVRDSKLLHCGKNELR